MLVFLDSTNLQLLEKTVYFMDQLTSTCQFIDVLSILRDIRNTFASNGINDAVDTLQSLIHKLENTTKDEL